MPKTSSVFTRVEPELKEKVERVLDSLGIPMANAINMFFHQIVIHNGIPFELRLPQSTVPDYSMITAEQFNEEIGRGIASMEAGRVISSEDVKRNLRSKLNT